MARMTAGEIATFLADHFPAAATFGRIAAIRDDELDLVLPFRAEFLRPGDTVSGPTLMALADTAAYLLVLAHVGPVALAVTTNLNINFLRRPAPADLIATARLLKLGARLAVCEVHLRTAGEPAVVAQASVTYALPPRS